MTLAIHFAARTDVGLVRSRNEDSGYAGPHLLAVADGMGGHAGGNVASSLVLARLAPLDGDSHGADDALELLADTVAEANRSLARAMAADPGLHGMGTTLTALMRCGSTGLALVHIGDSRAHLLREGTFTQMAGMICHHEGSGRAEHDRIAQATTLIDALAPHVGGLRRKRWILPVAVLGKASVKTIRRGYL